MTVERSFPEIMEFQARSLDNGHKAKTFLEEFRSAGLIARPGMGKRTFKPSLEEAVTLHLGLVAAEHRAGAAEAMRVLKDAPLEDTDWRWSAKVLRKGEQLRKEDWHKEPFWFLRDARGRPLEMEWTLGETFVAKVAEIVQALMNGAHLRENVSGYVSLHPSGSSERSSAPYAVIYVSRGSFVGDWTGTNLFMRNSPELTAQSWHNARVGSIELRNLVKFADFLAGREG